MKDYYTRERMQYFLVTFNHERDVDAAVKALRHKKKYNPLRAFSLDVILIEPANLVEASGSATKSHGESTSMRLSCGMEVRSPVMNKIDLKVMLIEFLYQDVYKILKDL